MLFLYLLLFLSPLLTSLLTSFTLWCVNVIFLPFKRRFRRARSVVLFKGLFRFVLDLIIRFICLGFLLSLPGGSFLSYLPWLSVGSPCHFLLHFFFLSLLENFELFIDFLIFFSGQLQSSFPFLLPLSYSNFL
jgi:hypothetical protein